MSARAVSSVPTVAIVSTTADGPSGPDVLLCPGGPMLLRGEHVVVDEAGVEHRTTRPVTAVCRCQRSARLPWCDGTHKLLPSDQRP